MPSTTTRHRRDPLAAKVPEIIGLFWVVKILTTGMGESFSDYLGTVSNLLWAIIGLTGLIVAMWLQLRTRRYYAPVYWFAVTMVAIVGTRAADLLHNQVGIPFWGSTSLYAGLVVLVFSLWYRSEGTLSIHSIVTRRRETYYWITVLMTFALGTAAGDMTASTLGLGYLASALLFAGLMLIPAIGWRWFGLNEVVAFWSAYVLTRPLGASVADWLGKPPHSGLGVGDGTVSAIAAVMIIGFVAYLTVTRPDIQAAPSDSGLVDTIAGRSNAGLASQPL